MLKNNRPDLIQISSFVLVTLALLAVLMKGLLGALLAGLLVYSLVHKLAPMFGRRFSNDHARALVVTSIGIIVIGVLTAACWGAISYLQGDAGHSQTIYQRFADMIDASRAQFPEWLRSSLPDDADGLREMLTHWLREHANETTAWGTEAGRALVSSLLGMIIGAMVAMQNVPTPPSYRPLAAALCERVATFAEAFERIVFAQVKIAAVNTVFTGSYILIVLPLLGIHLPLAKSMVLITFFAGLLPIIGNLISNSILVIVSMSVSFHTAVASLSFLVIIHKLEYFLNARIIGGQIQSRAWELLVAMLVMETLFGIPGVVAAPVFYAYVKRELMQRELV